MTGAHGRRGTDPGARAEHITRAFAPARCANTPTINDFLLIRRLKVSFMAALFLL